MIRIASSRKSAAFKRVGYRNYSAESLTSAYIEVNDGLLTVAKAARKYNIPDQTLRDRVSGYINAESFKSGPAPVFNIEQKSRLVNHTKYMESIGYGYTRADVLDIATDYAVQLGLRPSDKPLSFKWFYGLLDRWPKDLKVLRPKTISDLRAKATSRKSISKYFEELHKILEKYELLDKPQCIYNVDVKGITQNVKPQQVVGSAVHVSHVLMSEKSGTTTIIGCGARMRRELLEGAVPGTDGDVSQTGWSNSVIFKSYLENHFMNFAAGYFNDYQKLLLMYDGHRIHITPDIIDWAISKSVIFFVLPPHTSHILQHVGCFGPFSTIFSAACIKYQRTNSRVVNR
ncbi:hypothetical protein KUTeg_020055 [Tegillarca granosa]|uniref:Transposase n=1 Tax=Tegillarca granosa TaxID=220873 RepID=A0ABQ9E6N8_TEGGR|nr:hypothetical protein KUTeg_020055 [Tegillarca granosa]